MIQFSPCLWLMLAALTLCSLHADQGGKIVKAARSQVGITVRYDPAYVSLEYPGGDVPRDRGVCTDVIIRALRTGISKDLQALVHHDMTGNFKLYPTRWGLKRPDRNIDHRRVPNLQTWFKRQGYELPLPKAGEYEKFKAGDLVTCTVPPNLPHIVVVSDRISANGNLLGIHNIGAGTVEEDVLSRFPLTGHYRVR